MKNEFERAIERAYSSKLRIEHRGDKAIILKSVDAQERKNELAFHALLAELGMPSMHVVEEGEDLVIDFIADAETLGDAETPEQYERLGRALQALHSREYPSAFVIESDGSHREISWSEFLKQQVDYGVIRQHERAGLSDELVDNISSVVSTGVHPDRITPIHGDVHANNVLSKDGALFLFDKADHIFAGDPLYDLALFGITLSGIYDVGSEARRDKSLMEALIAGYGSDFLSDCDMFDRYVLLRAIERWPNPFEDEIPALVQVILEKLK